MDDSIRNSCGERLDYVFTAAVTPSAHSTSKPTLAIVGHGVTSHHDRPYFTELCEAFAAAGIASVRFSYAGNGGSEGRFEEATITKEVGDLGSVIDAFPEYAPLYIGHSMGSAVGILRASQDMRLRGLVCLAGMVHVQAFMERVFGHLEPDRDLMLGRAGCPLTSNFLADARAVGSVLEAAATLQLPMLLVHGTADELISVQDSRDVHAANAASKLVELEGVDHRFTGHIPEMVEAVVGWVDALSGLLSDTSAPRVSYPVAMKSVEDRLTDLEVRYTEQEDTLQKLDEVVREQSELIEKLAVGLRHYSERVTSLGGDAPERGLEDDKPPHY